MAPEPVPTPFLGQKSITGHHAYMHSHTHSQLGMSFCSQFIYGHAFGRLEETGESGVTHMDMETKTVT